MSFLILALLFIALPFMPSLYEIVRRTDLKPLRISQAILKDPRSNPEAVFWHLTQTLLLPSLQALKERATVMASQSLPQGLLFMPEGTLPALPKDTGRTVCSGNLELVSQTAYTSKILCFGHLKSGIGSMINELHTIGDTTLSENTRVLWWASGENVVIEKGTQLPGKIQAKQIIEVKGNTRFHLFEARAIHQGNPLLKIFKPASHGTRTRINKSFELKAGEIHKGDLVIKGNLILGEGAQIQGDVKANGKLILKQRASILGNAVSTGEIELMGENQIEGVLLSQRDISIGSGTQIGSPAHSITVSARRVQLTGQITVYGTLRAWKSAEWTLQ